MTCVGDRQLQLSKVLERTPSSSFIDALSSFVAWMVNAEQLLASETFVVDELEVMEHQLSQYMVRLVLSRDHSFPRQIFPNSAGQYAKFRSSPRQIYHT